MKTNLLNKFILLAIFTVVVGLGLLLLKPPAAQLDTFWNQTNSESFDSIPHELWQQTLDDYLISDHDSGINRFDYAGLQDDGGEALQQYLQQLSSIDPRTYNRAEQFAYWINLYLITTQTKPTLSSLSGIGGVLRQT